MIYRHMTKYDGICRYGRVSGFQMKLKIDSTGRREPLSTLNIDSRETRSRTKANQRSSPYTCIKASPGRALTTPHLVIITSLPTPRRTRTPS